MTLVELDAIQRARQRIVDAVRVTPLVPASSDESWAHLWLKCENLQAGGAFKLRGAFNFVSQLDPAVRAARRHHLLLGQSRPGDGAGGPAAGRAGCRRDADDGACGEGGRRASAFGADVQFAGTTSIDRKLAAEALAAERGLTIVPPFDHADIIAGQGTAGLEIVEQQPT